MRATGFEKSNVERVVRRLGVSCATALVVLAGALPGEIARASVRNPEDLLIVDCLLPGQMRKLGRVANFMSARRPVRTTQADCEIRGGEFVSYDRANYQTALQVWMGQAETGDAEAQNYVGEIYAKGLGTAPDYGKAASWYEKSAAQQNKRAMINLGYLYEEGLGVPRDLAKALTLYRQASGASDELLFASTVTAQAQAAQAEIATLKQTVEQQREESAALRARIDELQRQVDQRRRALDQSQRELEDARAKVVAQQSTLVAPQQSTELNTLAADLATKEKRLAEERAALARDKTSHSEKLKLDQARLAALKSEEDALNRKLSASAAAEATTVRKDLDRVRSAAAELALVLDDAFGKMGALEAKLADNEKRLAEEQIRFEGERQKMQAALAASQQDRELLLLLEQKLAEKQKEVTNQRDQIQTLQTQITGVGTPGAVSGTVLASAGPLLEIIEPALTITRGRPAATVLSAGGKSEIVGKVFAKAGLKQVLVNGQAIEVAPNGLFRVSIPIAAEGSNVQVSAVDRAGSRAAVDRAGSRAAVEFLLIGSGSGQGSAIASSSTAPAQRSVPRGVNLGRYYAVVIGNDQYLAYPKLTSAANDARRVADVLKSRYRFDTRLLVNASRFDILSALNEMRESLKPEDNLVVYFAGHGELEAQSKQGYWIPVDAQANQPSTWISNRAISDILNTMQSRHVLVVADSCYSGAMTRSSVPRFASGMAADQWSEWVRTMSQSRSRTALTSGGLAPVPDSSGGANSLFAKSLVAVLEDNNQLLEAQKLFRGISASLALAATESALNQSPEYAPIQFAGHEAGEFFFMPVGGGARATGAGAP